MKQYMLFVMGLFLCGAQLVADAPSYTCVVTGVPQDAHIEVNATAEPDAYLVGLSHINIEITNKGDAVTKILWDQSGIYFNSASSLIFTTGQRYLDANKPMSATSIPPGVTVRMPLYAGSEVIYYSRKWFILPMFTEKVVTLLALDVAGKTIPVTVTATFLSNTEYSRLITENAAASKSDIALDYYLHAHYDKRQWLIK